MTLREVGGVGPEQVRGIEPAPDQWGQVASVADSLAEVAPNPALTAYAVYDAAQRGLQAPSEPPVGFAVTEQVAGVGFVLLVLIDQRHQGQGYGRALMTELVRRLRLVAAVELIATSHRSDNRAMANVCASLGFVPWATPFPPPEGETYLRLDG